MRSACVCVYVIVCVGSIPYPTQTKKILRYKNDLEFFHEILTPKICNKYFGTLKFNIWSICTCTNSHFCNLIRNLLTKFR